jgi:methylated-DNA-[protein]-cysteine S-methyltransferase
MLMVNFHFSTSCGSIAALITRKGVRNLYLGIPADRQVSSVPVLNDNVTNDLHAALDNYFSGKPESFAETKVDLDSPTLFQVKVWQSARKIKWGQTSSYGELATLMGRDAGCARAVGNALGANPIPLLVPCHRILAAGGGLGGFSCGLEWKRALLAIEGHAFS